MSEKDIEVPCKKCGSDELIVEYYNTQMDVLTSVDIFETKWVENHTDAIERVDCANCDNIIFVKDLD